MANHRAMRRSLARFCIAAAMVLGATRALAAPVLSVDVTTVGGYMEYSASPTAVEITNPDGSPTGTFSFGDYGYATGSFSCGWSAVVNPDPSIAGTFNLTNLSATTQTFILTITLPTSLAGPTRMGGSFGDVTYTDVGGAPGGGPDSSVTLATILGDYFYRALIDGNPTGSPGPGDLGSFTVTAFGGPGVFGTISQQSFGVPIPSAPGPGVTSSIGMRVKFSLTAGDRVQVPVFFQVEAPEPSSALLIGLGLAGLGAARKRARA